jgi:3-oxoacyl-[acyl-carrier protein] reductase
MSARIILVTGANGGLGQAIVRNFLEESPDNFVWLGVRTRRDVADRIVAEASGRCAAIDLEVTDPVSWKKAVKAIVDRHDRLDVLINNAGTHQDSLLATMSLEAWDTVIATNLSSTFHGCQAVLPAMVLRRNGRIINVASLSALLAPGGQTNYAAAKAGVVALTQSLAKEVARLNITVNALCPGYVESAMLTGMNDEERKSVQSRIPMRRFGKPEEVAAAVRFLAGPNAGYITGSILKIDGGIL